MNRFLARQGCHYQDGEKWTQNHWAWIGKIRFDDMNAQTVLEESIRAVEQSQEQLKTFDSKIVAEVWDMSRYGTAPQFMASTGLVSSEYSTGDHERRGKITKAGNAHLRSVLVEAG